MNTRIVNLDLDEIWPLLNVLNEVCYGIRICDFEEIIGVRKDSVVNLMDKISKEENKKSVAFVLNDLELKILDKSFKEVFNQIDEWEFQTRIGISMQEARMIKKKLE